MSNKDGASKLEELKRAGWLKLYPPVPRITVSMATCGRAAGGSELVKALSKKLGELNVEAEVVSVGCQGLCWAEPLVEIQIPGQPRAVYGNVETSRIEQLLQGLKSGQLPEEGRLGLVYRDEFPLAAQTYILSPGNENDLAEHEYLKHQTKIAMSSSGRIEPASAAEYAASGGYSALEKVLNLRPEEVIKIIEDSGLRGRGGAGFPTGEKWRLARKGLPGQRTFIVNADEGDPGAYMDRGLLESDPHRVLEGLAIGAYAIGAGQAYIFIRAEYPLAIETLQKAIGEAQQAGLLGEHILGSDFSLKVALVRSAGAYVCGEESALIQVLENKNYQPVRRPPYPTEEGLWGTPTCINNVETLANVPFILARGADEFKKHGTEQSPGTKIFSLVGSVARAGLIEVPLGTSIGEIVETIGGTTEVKAVQIGGPSGAILPARLSNLPVDYENLQAAGGIMGSGGLVVLDHKQCVVDTVHYFLDFSARESCGKCKPCRDGLKECRAILEKISSGQGEVKDLEELEQIAAYIAAKSFCGLGKMAAGPVLSSLRYFRQEYEEHLNGHCYALVCKPLIHFEIIPERCQGERCCLQSCPGNAIKGAFGKPGRIEERLCTKCWMCTTSCPYDALRVYS